MKLKESKPKPNKPKTPIRRSSVKKSVTKKKTIEKVVEKVLNLEPVQQHLVFETPNKGFRPFEIVTPQALTKEEPFEIIKPEASLPERNSTPSKRQKTSDHADIWTAGIENQTYVSNEFDFVSFPIQY